MIEVATCVVERESKLLLVQRSEEDTHSGRWEFPGGEIENNEARQEAAIRELKEETGLELDILESGESYRAGDGNLMIFPFLFRTGKSEISLSWEHMDYRWMKPEEIEELETLGTLEALQKFSQGTL